MKGMVITLQPRTLECRQHKVVFRLNWNHIFICQKKRTFNLLVFLLLTTFLKYWAKYWYWLLTIDHGVTMSRWYFPIFWLSSISFSKVTFYVLVDMAILQPIRVACDCVLTELWRSRKLGWAGTRMWWMVSRVCSKTRNVFITLSTKAKISHLILKTFIASIIFGDCFQKVWS